MDDNRFFVRDEADTSLAVRDEIVRLTERRLLGESRVAAAAEAAGADFGNGLTVEAAPAAAAAKPGRPARSRPAPALMESAAPPPASTPVPARFAPPRTGVEIVRSEERQGTLYHTVRDLRNGNLITNVTKSSARKLWHYAISSVEAGGPELGRVRWHGDAAVLNARRKDNHIWYDLALRDGDEIHVYYGVTDSGLNEEWLELIERQGEREG
jgi:hypothetical protein